jgi:hypothetical protein
MNQAELLIHEAKADKQAFPSVTSYAWGPFFMPADILGYSNGILLKV